MPNLSDHDLKQMDPAWQQRQPEPTVRGLLERALDDLRQARDRLNQNPTNSSRPPTSMEPWRRGGAAEPEAAAVADDSEPAEPAQAASPEGEGEPAAKAPSPPAADAEGGAARRGPGKQPGAPGFGRTQKLAITDTESRHPLRCVRQCARSGRAGLGLVRLGLRRSGRRTAGGGLAA